MQLSAFLSVLLVPLPLRCLCRTRTHLSFGCCCYCVCGIRLRKSAEVSHVSCCAYSYVLLLIRPNNNRSLCFVLRAVCARQKEKEKGLAHSLSPEPIFGVFFTPVLSLLLSFDTHKLPQQGSNIQEKNSRKKEFLLLCPGVTH